MEFILKLSGSFWDSIRMIFSPKQSARQRYEALLAKTDAEAIYSDWAAVGKDLSYALEEYGKQNGQSK